MAHTVNDTNRGVETLMQAPRPFYEVYTRRGSLYKADSYGIIEDVHGSDIQDLRNAGCKDLYVMGRDSEITVNPNLLSSTESRDQSNLVQELPETPDTPDKSQPKRKAKAASPEGEITQAAEPRASNGLVPPSTDEHE